MLWIGILLVLAALAESRSDAVCASNLKTYDSAADLKPGLRVLHAGPCYIPVQDAARSGHNVRSSNVWTIYRNGLRTNVFAPETSEYNPGFNGGGGYYPPNGGGYPGGSYQPGGFQPGGYQPGGYQPGGYQPGGYQPGGYQPGGYQPGGYQPGGFQPGGIQPGGYQPGGYQPGGFPPGGPPNCGVSGQPCQPNAPFNSWNTGQQNIGAAPER